MSTISRRKLITTGLAATAGVAGLATASHIARRYGLIPPDGATLYGPGETLTYAAQRLLTRHSLAREFPRSMISKTPFRNETAPPSDAFKRHQAANFTDWRLTVDGMVAHPTAFSLADLKSREIVSLVPLVVLAVWVGVYPNTFLNLVHLPVQQIVDRVVPSLAQAHGGALAQLVHFTRGLL